MKFSSHTSESPLIDNVYDAIPTAYTTLIFLQCIVSVAAAAMFVPPPRRPDINVQPNAKKAYTIYTLASPQAYKNQIAGVEHATGNNSFVSRVLRVINNRGQSKDTIIGEDGLTFGIKDFTSGGVYKLLKLIDERYPGEVKATFGSFAAFALNAGWLDRHTSKQDDHGLVAERQLRVGLDRILTKSALSWRATRAALVKRL
jgi:hypothetical protein